MIKWKNAWKRIKAGALNVAKNPAWGNACRNVTKDLSKAGNKVRWK